VESEVFEMAQEPAAAQDGTSVISGRPRQSGDSTVSRLASEIGNAAIAQRQIEQAPSQGPRPY
jgi:hypothetical protein